MFGRRNEQETRTTPLPAYRWSLEMAIDWNKIIERQFPEVSKDKIAKAIDIGTKERSEGGINKRYKFSELGIPNQNVFLSEIEINHFDNERRSLNLEELTFPSKIFGEEIELLELEKEKGGITFGDLLTENLVEISPYGIQAHAEDPVGPSGPGEFICSFPFQEIFTILYTMGSYNLGLEKHQIIEWSPAMNTLLQKKNIKYEMSNDRWYHSDLEPEAFDYEKYTPEVFKYLGGTKFARSHNGTHIFLNEFCDFYLRIELFTGNLRWQDRYIDSELLGYSGCSTLEEYLKKIGDDK